MENERPVAVKVHTIRKSTAESGETRAEAEEPAEKKPDKVSTV